MKTPLRSPRKVYDELKNQVNPGSGNQIRLSDFLLKNSNLPPTLTDGRFSQVNVNPEWSLTEILKKCLQEVPQNKVGIIVIHPFMTHFPESETCSCRKIVLKTLFNKAFVDLRKLRLERKVLKNNMFH